MPQHSEKALGKNGKHCKLRMILDWQLASARGAQELWKGCIAGSSPMLSQLARALRMGKDGAGPVQQSGEAHCIDNKLF
jgi:hypothetical protein